MIRDIRHTGIVVKDLDKSVYFYRDLLGFKIERQMEERGGYIEKMLALKDVYVTTIKMSTPNGQMIELLLYHSHPCEQVSHEICDIGISHIAFTLEDLDNAYEKLKGDGISFNSPPQISPDGYAKIAFCRAPEGTFIELVEVIRNQ